MEDEVYISDDCSNEDLAAVDPKFRKRALRHKYGMSLGARDRLNVKTAKLQAAQTQKGGFLDRK